MTLDEFIQISRPMLIAAGFVQSGEQVNGSMGSSELRFTSGTLEICLESDRGYPLVVLGQLGGRSFTFRIWAALLGVPFDDNWTQVDHLTHFLSLAPQIDEAIRINPGLDGPLLDLNWEEVKKFLSINSDVQRPKGTKTIIRWSRRGMRD